MNTPNSERVITENSFYGTHIAATKIVGKCPTNYEDIFIEPGETFTLETATADAFMGYAHGTRIKIFKTCRITVQNNSGAGGGT